MRRFKAVLISNHSMASSRPKQVPSFVEALEARIAPAIVINVGAPLDAEGVPVDPSSYNYKYAPPGEPLAFRSLGSGDGGAPVYALDLGTTPGSDVVRQVKLFNFGESFQPWLTTKGDPATAFFRDINSNDVVEGNELTGISFTDRLNLTVDGSVFGDIVGTGGGNGTSLVAPVGASISFLRVSGSVEGAVVGAGAISNVDIAGAVERVSTASDGKISFNLGLGEQTLKAFVPAAATPGGSLANIKIGEARIPDADPAILVRPGILEAGDGGAGAAGGSISKVTVVDDPDGLSILAGSGGGGARGGVGGSISQVTIYGAGEALPGVAKDFVRIEAGDGGLSSGNGSRGGNVVNVSVGYGIISGKLGPSPEPSDTPVFISAGDGGDGARGGAGGFARDVRVLIDADDRLGVNEITIAGGNGGKGSSFDGPGGQVTKVRAENVYFNLVSPGLDRDSIVITAGNGGEGAGNGARGGSVSQVSAMADRIEVIAGRGSDGTSLGGAGGSLSGIEILFNESEQARSLELRGGDGGKAGSSGRGGAGGGVTKVQAAFTDFLNDAGFVKDSLVAGGNGGSGAGAGGALVGGAGGSLNNIKIFEPGETQDFAVLRFDAGKGGDATRTGGQGGAITGLSFIGFATAPVAQAGEGGAASAGKGGAGGALRNVVLRSDWVLGTETQPVPNVSASAGNGGNGAGASGRGGAGGAATNVNVRVSGPLQATTASQGYIDASPESPAVLSWSQFNTVAEKASLVDVALSVTGTVDSTALLALTNNAPAGTPEIVINGATSKIQVEFVGENAPATISPLQATIMPLIYVPLVGQAQELPVNIVGGGSSIDLNVGVIFRDLPSFSPVPLRSLQADLLSAETNSDAFFTGSGSVDIKVGQDFLLDYVTFEGVSRDDLLIDSSAFVASGTTELTYRSMKWVDANIVAGNGGAGQVGGGVGGSMSKVYAITLAGDGSIKAGDAGTIGSASGARAKGGSITSALVTASEDINVLAGDGRGGGAGGSIRNLGWLKGTLDAAGDLDGLISPTGNILVEAGDGSALGLAGGAGGSIDNASGFSSSLAASSVRIVAGDGNGDGGGRAGQGTAGGFVSRVNFYGGFAAPEIIAGQGGASTAGSGGNGGSVSAVTAAPGLDVLQIAAGNGGDGTSRGGAGGSVAKINVFDDIGVRGSATFDGTGKPFGFDTAAADGAGGIFAGAGGNGATDGRAGRVTDITAAAISSIVAGRPTSADPQTLQLVSLADRIYLRGLNVPTVETSPVGSFSVSSAPAQLPSAANPFGKPATVAFEEANLVGSIAGSPYVAGANIYKTSLGPVAGEDTAWNLGSTRPVDGLVAAITLGQNKNFRPEALLTVSDPRNPVNFVLIDYRNDFNANS